MRVPVPLCAPAVGKVHSASPLAHLTNRILEFPMCLFWAPDSRTQSQPTPEVHKTPQTSSGPWQSSGQASEALISAQVLRFPNSLTVTNMCAASTRTRTGRRFLTAPRGDRRRALPMWTPRCRACPPAADPAAAAAAPPTATATGSSEGLAAELCSCDVCIEPHAHFRDLHAIETWMPQFATAPAAAAASPPTAAAQVRFGILHGFSRVLSVNTCNGISAPRNLHIPQRFFNFKPRCTLEHPDLTPQLDVVCRLRLRGACGAHPDIFPQPLLHTCRDEGPPPKRRDRLP